MVFPLRPAITFGVSLAATLLIRRLLLGAVRRRAKPRSFAAVFVDTVRVPSILWCLAAAVAISLEFVDLEPKYDRWASRAMAIFVIASLSLVAASIAVRSMVAYGERQGIPLAAAGLSRTLIRVLVLAVGFFSLLAYLNVTIAPLLTALGIGGLAVALALQDTLANFFAGVHILAERPIFVGDFIRLENGQEGVVTDIGWRTTRVRTGSGNIIVVPNTKITSGILVNYNLPDPGALIEVAILVGLEADPDQVAAIALDETRHVEGVEGEPIVLCDPGVLPTHMQFKLLVRAPDQLQRGRIQSDIRLRLLRRFRRQGIPLPKPELALARFVTDADRR